MSQSLKISPFISKIYPADTAPEAEQKLNKLLETHEEKLRDAQKRFQAGGEVKDSGGPGSGGASAASAGVAGRAAENINRSRLPLSEEDAFVICYGDSFLLGDEPADPDQRKNAALGVGGGIDEDGTLHSEAPEDRRHLKALAAFAERHLKDVVSGIHILPFFPYSSDDGFSIIDYYRVNPDLGDWKDINRIASDFRLMADLVLNHCSAKGPWFQAYLKGDPEYQGFFIDLPEDSDVRDIVRPRTHPLLTPFKATDPESGKAITRHVWTTFSADQVDLNFGHPGTLIQMIDAILFFIEQGAQVIRLDAIAYLWKELGTPSIHHEKTHLVVQLYRHILDVLAPWVVLITETNVPHRENMSYFGNGVNEAHMIYQFSLPPLIFDAFLRGDASHLRDWARTIPSGNPGPVGYHSTYFNFCASHDGIGVTPAHGILSEDELQDLYDAAESRGGRISYKATPQGKIPYELNINYFSAIADPDLPTDIRVKKFLASQAVLLSLAGVPGIYIHSLIGSENWEEGVNLTGANRTINRQKLFLSRVEEELADPDSLRSLVFSGYTNMIKTRRKQKAFHPAGKQSILDVGSEEVFAVLRESPLPPHGGEPEQIVLCLINTSARPVNARLNRNLGYTGIAGKDSGPDFYDLLSDQMFCTSLQCFDQEETDGDTREDLSERTAVLKLAPWEVLWLEIRSPR
ncbi:sugar phosphorylase [Salinispira pacifica]|uniref:Putative sucrose phosphorylase n=1 Tax=Salinispira pacifica TaxID=1307761 RepID=V5WNG8_9SPIO|nr:sugar phosphorylase [Salinispira pacifica]AHC16541.1 Putative sucrose phosphorylase [Salinispira pacifica]